MTLPKISRAEYIAIERRIAILRGEDAQATQELADATNNGAETWHDNAAFDAAKDKKNIATLSLARLDMLHEQAKIIEPTENPKKVDIGTCVRYLDVDTGQEHEICLAGDAAWLMGENWASVQAPLGKALYNAKVGDTKVFASPAGDKELTVIAISHSAVE
ncbi:MAG: transcription elongation factor GreA [Patescibacteria group bacterium]|jgi:transcription elongation GreA/GreB family factor|nr:transcription elongation factor GreA [Patescibacteria group bacterium]